MTRTKSFVASAVLLVVVGACSSEGRPPVDPGIVGGGTVADGGSNEAAETARNPDAGEPGRVIPYADGGVDGAACKCGGCVFPVGHLTVKPSCGFGFCEDHVLSLCTSSCEIAIDKC